VKPHILTDPMDFVHEVVDGKCKSCWWDFYQPDRCKCGGYVHKWCEDESDDGDLIFDQRCDWCGDNYEIVHDGPAIS
jgi:hypothetical protein